MTTAWSLPKKLTPSQGTTINNTISKHVVSSLQNKIWMHSANPMLHWRKSLRIGTTKIYKLTRRKKIINLITKPNWMNCLKIQAKAITKVGITNAFETAATKESRLGSQTKVIMRTLADNIFPTITIKNTSSTIKTNLHQTLNIAMTDTE